MQIKANYHTHTTFCDGKNSPREMVEKAIELGFTHLGFSGHMDADIHMDLPQYTKEIRNLQIEYEDKIQILCGVEWDNLYDLNCTANMDYVIGSTHFLNVQYERPLSIDDTPEDVILLCNEFFGGDYYKLCKEYYQLEATIIDKYPCTFIGHFDLITKFNDLIHFVDQEDTRYLRYALEAMEYLVSKGVLFEINTRQSSRGRLFPDGVLLKALHAFGGKIIVNSDAHTCSELDKGFDYALQKVKESGFTKICSIIKKNDQIHIIELGI